MKSSLKYAGPEANIEKTRCQTYANCLTCLIAQHHLSQMSFENPHHFVFPIGITAFACLTIYSICQGGGALIFGSISFGGKLPTWNYRLSHWCRWKLFSAMKQNKNLLKNIGHKLRTILSSATGSSVVMIIDITIIVIQMDHNNHYHRNFIYRNIS